MNKQVEEHLMRVTNKKTGDYYYVDDVVIDATNELEPEEQVKVLYTNDKAERFVREAHEFFEKFDIPHGFNILSKACELAMQDVEKFHNRVVEVGKVTWDPTDCSLNDTKVVVDDEQVRELINKHNCSCGGDCSCNNKKEYIGEMIDPEVYKTYVQTAETSWYAPVDIVKAFAGVQLRELFSRRCNAFEIVKKEYDNSTTEYFLVGYKSINESPKTPLQVCKLPKEVFISLYDCITGEDEDDKDIWD